ncbi:MAG: dihydrodipicolinate synthase family protein, partial [Oscillospiraceae bacterium]|nr:dihydrodipicolinate synthase family protein [Oscillospiraceae bacterium]
CNNTADSQELAAHAESLGVDAIASIPPIYFKLPPHAIAKYWNDMSAAAPNTDFIIYNIPQLAGVSLSIPLLKEMLKNPKVIGVKNSSMPTQDIQMWRDEGAIVFNGPDEQLISGLVMGATGGIGGTYGAMPELYVELYRCVKAGELAKALEIQNECCRIIYKMCSTHGNMYGVIKEILRKMNGPDCGSVRAPLAELIEADMPIVDECVAMIQAAVAKYC